MQAAPEGAFTKVQRNACVCGSGESRFPWKRTGGTPKHEPGYEASSPRRRAHRNSRPGQRATTFAAFDSRSSRPRNARGNSMALNSAPISTMSEIMYIHTSRAIPTPSEP